MFVTSPDVYKVLWQIQQDLVKQVDYFKEIGKHLEAKRLEERTNFDLEMIRELGYCSGIENYSVIWMEDYPTRPFCLLDYFPKDFLLVVTYFQEPCMAVISRKENLVEYGRLPAAMDNRPLNLMNLKPCKIKYVSATPADYE
jgi:excinuclease ABC subunit B